MYIDLRVKSIILVRFYNNNNNNIFNCKWAVTRWQWLLCMYINMK